MGQIEDLKESSAKKRLRNISTPFRPRPSKGDNPGIQGRFYISHDLNEHGTGYECLKSIGVKSESYHMNEYPTLIQIVEFERVWRTGKSMVGL